MLGASEVDCTVDTVVVDASWYGIPEALAVMSVDVTVTLGIQDS